MRNLKRTLSLALASVMLLGMMVIGAGAAFTDVGTIKNTEAVDVVSVLGIINGLPDGSFGPEKMVDRASMAKMICIALSGGKDPILGTKDKPSYTDIKGNWAESYIEYCSNVGIVSGKGNGTFAPSTNVSGSEAAKMLLVALGYDATVFKFTGSDWQIGVNVQANNAKLYNGLNIVANEPLSRDNAAQMIHNALNAMLMVKTPSIDLATGGISYTYVPGKISMLEEKFGVIKVTGIVTGNEFTEGSSMKGKTHLEVTNYGKDKEQEKFNSGNYAVVTGSTELGKNISLFVKPYNSSSSSTEKASVLGAAIVNSDTKVFTTGKSLANDSTKSNDIVKTLKAEGLKFDSKTPVTLYTNYNTTSASDKGAVPVATIVDPTTAANLTLLLNKKGVEAQYIDNTGDGIVDVVSRIEAGFGKVSVYTTTGNGTLLVNQLGSKVAGGISSTNATDDVSDFANLNLAKNDYATYIYVAGSGTYYVKKAESITVDVTSKSGGTALADRGTTIKASGTEYGESSLAGDNMNSSSKKTLADAVELGKSAVLYLDKFSNVIYVTDVSTTSKYLMVTDVTAAGAFSDSLTAKMVLSDGTFVTATVSKIDGKTIVKSNPDSNEITVVAAETALKTAVLSATAGANGRVYTYSVDSNGKYEVNAQTTKYNTLASASTPGTEIITNSNPTVNVSGGTILANTTTPIIMGSGSSYSLYTGISKVPTRTNVGSAVGLYAYVDGNAKVIFVTGGAGATSTNNYMYFLGATPSQTLDSSGNRVYSYDVIRKGVVTTIEGTGSSVSGVPSDGGLVKVTLSGDKASSASAAADSVLIKRGLATEATDGVVSNVNGSCFFNDNTIVYIVKGGTATLATVDTIITEGGARDSISILRGTGSDSATAQYVFIER